MEQNANIILTGFMGVGKSTVGSILATRLTLRYLDTDTLIEARQGLEVKEIFARFGEARFRELEAEILGALLNGEYGTGFVISTGGGIVIEERNRQGLKKLGTVVCLMATTDTIISRIKGQDKKRPLLSGPETRLDITQLLNDRRRAYSDADIVVDTTDKDAIGVAIEIERSLGVKVVNVEPKNPSLNARYPIIIKRGLIDELGQRLCALGRFSSVRLVTNPTVRAHYGYRVVKSLETAGMNVSVIEIPDGEQYKNLEVLSSVYDRLIEEKTERGSLIVALGGGVVGDLAGFAAATFLRGIPYVQVPTTLLAQVDSSVGGKTAVNHPEGKNLIGAFYAPEMVFIDPDVLSTLEDRDLRSGLAEVVKHAIIKDPPYFAFLRDHNEEILNLKDEVAQVIERSCSLKASVVGEDEREAGLRAILNFGHTFGHAIEAVAGYSTYRHGEAVSIGMVLATGFSAELGFCKTELKADIKALLQSFGLPTEVPKLDARKIADSMLLDKKVKNAKVRFVLLKALGEVTCEEISETMIRRYLEKVF